MKHLRILWANLKKPTKSEVKETMVERRGRESTYGKAPLGTWLPSNPSLVGHSKYGTFFLVCNSYKFGEIKLVFFFF